MEKGNLICSFFFYSQVLFITTAENTDFLWEDLVF